MLVGSPQLTSPTCLGFQYLQNNSKTLLCVSLEGEREPVPGLCYLFFNHLKKKKKRLCLLSVAVCGLPLGAASDDCSLVAGCGLSGCSSRALAQ